MEEIYEKGNKLEYITFLITTITYIDDIEKIKEKRIW